MTKKTKAFICWGVGLTGNIFQFLINNPWYVFGVVIPVIALACLGGKFYGDYRFEKSLRND